MPVGGIVIPPPSSAFYDTAAVAAAVTIYLSVLSVSITPCHSFSRRPPREPFSSVMNSGIRAAAGREPGGAPLTITR